MLSAVYDVVVCPSVCVCVCVSVTLRYCIITAKHRITQITPHDSPLTLVFWHQSSVRNSNGISPYGGDKCRWGGLKFVTFDEKRAIIIIIFILLKSGDEPIDTNINTLPHTYTHTKTQKKIQKRDWLIAYSTDIKAWKSWNLETWNRYKIDA